MTVELKHKAFIGQSGSGKSTYMCKMVKMKAKEYNFILILNTQHEDFIDKVSSFHAKNKEEILNHMEQKRRIVIYKISEEADIDEWEAFDELATWLWELKRYKENEDKKFLFVIDECDIYQTKNQISSIYKKMMTKGRKYNLEMWNITQRPQLIHTTILTQSKEIYMFETSNFDYLFLNKWFDYENPSLYEFVIIKN